MYVHIVPKASLDGGRLIGKANRELVLKIRKGQLGLLPSLA
jgi:hypothetical protein